MEGVDPTRRVSGSKYLVLPDQNGGVVRTTWHTHSIHRALWRRDNMDTPTEIGLPEFFPCSQVRYQEPVPGTWDTR